MKVLGAILIVLGLVGILWGGFTYTTQKKVIDLGPIQATREKTHSIPVPPIAGAVSLIAGIACLASEKRA
jgi:xanthosine utilization system XapX-like protein